MGGNRWPAALLVSLILPACGGAPEGPFAAHHEELLPTDSDIETFPDEGHAHVPVGTVVRYRTDPPTSGNHYPDPQDGGFFDHPIAAGYLVHSMEHGAVIIYYNPETVTGSQQDALKRLARQHPGSFSQVICVPRDDPKYPIILTAWTHRLRLAEWDRDRIDDFLTLYLGHGPEHDPTDGH
jgi:uncharacterized protein DUF3105